MPDESLLLLLSNAIIHGSLIDFNEYLECAKNNDIVLNAEFFNCVYDWPEITEKFSSSSSLLSLAAFYGQIETGRRSAPLQMRETSWGYIVAEKTSGSDDGHHAEAILRVLAVFMLFSSILPWVYFGGDLANNTIAAKLALSSGFFVIGVAAYLHAGRGFKNEIQIDSERREFRLATRNSRNIASVRRTIKMNNIESA